MYADRVDAAAKTSIKDRLNGNSIGDSARLRHVTGKSVEGDSNALIMPAKKSNKRKGMNQEQEVAKKNKNPQLSKSQKRKLKKLEEENERTLLLSKSIETLEKYKIPEDAFSLLQSSRNISRVETVKEKRRMAVQFSKAGLSPQGDQPFKRNHETASFEIEAGLDEIQSKMHMDEKGHLQPMVIGREVQNHASFSLVCHNPVSGNELGLNGRSVSALSAEEVSNEDNCTPTLEVPKKSSQASSDHDARKTSSLMGKLNETSTVDLGKASNFPDFPLLRPPTTPTVVHVSRPDEVEKKRKDLPIIMMEQEIMEAINERSTVIICGETGCGKTTQVPQFLYEAGYGSNHSVVRNGVIGVTQPRRIAVLATARRVAFELGLHLGKEVGFQVRHDKRIGDNCSIKFMTDGILLREVQTDILLKRYSVIILDEAHERSVNTDILIGMLSRVIQLRQVILIHFPTFSCKTLFMDLLPSHLSLPYTIFCIWQKKYEQQQKMVLSGQSLSPENMIFPLKLVLMSATLRVEDFISERRLFHDPPPVINVPTRQFEVTVHFSKRTETVDYIGQAYKKVMSIHKRLPQGGILVFVTGQREVEYLCQKLRKASTELIANTAKGRVGDEVPAMSEMVSIEGVDMKDIDEAFEIQGNLIDQQTERFGSHDEDVPDFVENESDVSYDSGSESEVEIVGDEVDIEDSKTSENDVVGVLGEKSSLAVLKSAFEALAGENASECKSEGKQIPSMPEESPEQYKNSMEKKTVGDKGLFTSALRVMPLYAMLPAVAQLHVFDEVKEGERLVVVATNVAETSLTIPGIKYVVDTGREKVKNYNSSNGMEAYEVQWISKASADQRKGRAGRTGPGHCYRLYSSAVYNNILPDFSCAEISKVPVDSIVLVLKSMHIDKVEKFPFPTPPEAAALVEAERCLKTLEALDNTGRLTSLGKAMACYPMSPRHSRMLLTAIQITRKMKDHDTANLVLGYAVATAAALSFSNAFLKHFEGSHTDSNGSEQDGRSSSLGSNKILDKQEKIKKKKLRETTKLSRARFSNSTSDTLTVAYALHCFELSTSPVEFCHENGLHLKTMEEMSKLRRQLLQLVFNHHVHELEQGFSWTHGTVEDVEQAWRVLSSKRSTLLNVEDILGQAICAGWVDRVAKRIRGNSGSLEGDRKASAVRYQACMVKETVFLHRRSSLSNSAPEFLVYSELLHTKRPYMHGATSIKPEWLAKYGVSLCSFSTVEDRKPEYDPQNDQLYRWVIPTFGPHLWRLPAQSMPISSDEDRLKVCAKFPELIHSLKQIKRGVKDQKLKG
ncbi:ATP-dependent RNA helicase DEAH13-like isoform X1 [Populus alba x Populus x berolinensis]|uniref:RNA helicase n=1 Tax=Populus alba x Populus x berolinensis TaxID=444605 RepID=A0AAD6WF81_9ROSI|nr:ATP-dependent RNA helicase DEAH13-like isoform X1 [Populus alba x Populus x berolinensis]